MDLEKAWGAMEEGPGQRGLLPGQFPVGKTRSLHPLVKVRRNLQVTNISGILISAGYIALMFLFPTWPIVLGFCIVLAFNAIFIYEGIKLRRQLPSSVDPSHSMLSEMKIHHVAMLRWIDNQMYAARFVYPVAAATGFMLGGMLGSGKPLQALFARPIFPIAMVISMVVFAFAGMWLARRLFQVSYKKHLDRLKQNIDMLEAQVVDNEA